MAIAKVVYKENASATPEVWMDTTQKTVTAGTMLSGTTALKNDGTGITGNIASKSSSDLTASGATVTAPAGYYPNSASKAVASGSASTPATSITANPTISVNASGLITASVSGSKSVTPTVSAGYVSVGTAGTVSVSGSNTQQLSTQAGTTITPTESEQTAVASGKYTTGAVKVGAISSTYVGSGITQRDSTNLTASGATVTAPAGYYAEAASKSVASGSAGTPTATKGTVSNHSISVTPSVTNATGYITGSTINGTAVTVDVTELESGTKSITANGTGISVSGYSAVDVDVPGQVPTGVKYIYTDIDGEGAWNVAGYEYCSVDYAPVRDEKFRYWVNISANDLTFTNPASVPSYSYYRYTGIIDWGDGTQNEFSYGNTGQVHTYSNAGIYCISIWRTGGSERLSVVAPNASDKPKVVGIELFLIDYPENTITSLPNAERLSITSEQTTVGFNGYNSVKSVLLPNTVTKIQNAYQCYALTKLTIPASVTDCSTNSLFTNNTSMKEYHFLPVNPPSLGTNAFGGIPSDCVIYVPSASLSAYQSATNWSEWASKMVGE